MFRVTWLTVGYAGVILCAAVPGVPSMGLGRWLLLYLLLVIVVGGGGLLYDSLRK
jgi:hypothetical protein